MNILRIVYDFADENVQTEGLSPGPYELSLAQAKLGHKIYVLCGNLNGVNFKKRNFRYTLANGSVVVYNLPRAWWKFGPFLSTSLFVLPYYWYLRFSKKINLVHNHQQLGVWFLVYKYFFWWLDKIPVIHVNHGSIKGRELKALSKGEELPFMTKYFEYPIWKFNDFLSVKVAASIIVVSDDLVLEIQEFYNPSKPIYVVENSVDTERFKREGSKYNLGFSNNSIVMMNIGRLSKRKNIDLIVESLVYLSSNYKLVLIGIWESDYRDHVEKIINKNNLQDRVSFLGKISNFGVQEYMRSADIFILPSSHEGLPKVVVEALAVGNKVIASGFKMSHKVPNIYYLDKTNPNNIARLTEQVMKKENFYKETRNIIERYYSWDAKAKEIDIIYKKVL